MLVDLQSVLQKEISYEYIRGLTEGEGCFSFSPDKNRGSMMPSFTIRMHERDKKLLTIVRDRLKLKNRVYEYNYPGKDGYKRGPTVTLIVREVGNLKNVIVPLFYKKLIGNKSIQFEKWMETIGNDQRVTRPYKFIYFLYKNGYYDKVHDFD
jgi:hypothetical protein